MWRFIYRQSSQAIMTLFLALLILFTTLQLNSDLFIAGQMGWDANEELRLVTETEFQLNYPIAVRLVKWVGRVITGRIFDSYVYGGNILPYLLKALGTSLLVISISMVLGIALSIALAMLAVHHKHRFWDGWIRGISLLGISIHELTFCMFFVVLLRRSMVGLAFLGDGEPLFTSGFMNFWVASLLPILFLTMRLVGVSVRYIQSEMLSVISQEFIAAERSRGIPLWRIYWRSVLGNSYTAIVPSLGAMFIEATNCMVIVELLFRIPGFFVSFYYSALSQDTNLMIGHGIIAIALVIVINMLLDLLLAAVDPRITYN